MSTIHRTTMSPSKLELLAAWLPGQQWYVGPESPELHRSGGFRLDDPAGEVGIEFMIVNAVGADSMVTYHVPMTYRGEPLRAAEPALIGTATHGVLGQRWIYDGTADPVLLDQLTALLCGDVLAQHQSRSDEVAEGVFVSTAQREVAGTAHILRVPAEGPVHAAPSVVTTWVNGDGAEVGGAVVAP